MKTAALIAFSLVTLACGAGSNPVAPPPASSVPEGVYDIRGTVVAVDRPRRIVEIDHEAIPGVMPAMTMPYEVADAAILDGIGPRDRVRGTLRVDARGYVITALQRADAPATGQSQRRRPGK